MIQRQQTIFLLLAVIVMVSMFYYPLAMIMANEDNLLVFKLSGVMQSSVEGANLMKTFALLFLNIVVTILILIDIFLYKKRILQMRICIYSILLLIGWIALLLFYLHKILVQFGDTQIQYKVSVIMPLITIILLYLAFRGIRKDELLVRAIDRIR